MPRRSNGYRGEAFNEPPLQEPPPENGLVSIYLSPNRQSDVIHWIALPVGEGLTCNTKIPLGRIVARPDATEPTCNKCVILKRQREERLERRANS